VSDRLLIDDVRLRRERIIFVTGEINEQVANTVTAQLLFLQFENKTKDVHLHVNSPGGAVTAALAIYDTIQFVKCDVETVAVGHAAGMALMLVAAGKSGKRLALKHARLQMTDFTGGAQGTPQEIEIQKQEMARLRKAVDEIFVKHTGRTPPEIEEARKAERFFSAEEAFQFGLIDGIVERPPR
jgi:ATP-dependent Clp protease protease subunit